MNLFFYNMKKKQVSTINSIGFSGIWKNYPFKNLIKSLKYPSIISLSLFILQLFSKKNVDDQILNLSELIITIIPNVLGFILTGYALIIGLTGTDTIIKMSKDKEANKSSLFQIVNSTFAFVLIALTCIAIFGFVINYIVKADLFILNFPNWMADYTNYLIFFLLALSIVYTLFAIKDIVLNVFNFGQFVHSINKNKDEVH